MRRYVERAHDPPAVPGSDDEWREYVRIRGGISYHPVSTCRMGVGRGRQSSTSALARSRLRRLACRGRVDHAALISGNTNAPTIMIGEKGADMILQDSA